MPSAQIAAINLDCDEPRALANFWADLLGGEVVLNSPDFCAVRAGGDGGGANTFRGQGVAHGLVLFSSSSAASRTQ